VLFGSVSVSARRWAIVLAWLAGGLTVEPAWGLERPPAPPDLQPLIKAGRVTFKFYDAQKAPRQYRGLATFKVTLTYKQRPVVRRGRKGGQTRRLVVPQFLKLAIHTRHEVLLPNDIATETFWSDTLVRHEFDHVAISSDPRVTRLLQHMLRNLQIEIAEQAPSDEKRLNQLITDEVEKRWQAIHRLLEANYLLLDRVTEYGTRPLPDREAFFQSLFTKTNLDEMKFPYLGEVVDLLDRLDQKQ
jgi:hypothetical protein